MGKYFAETFSGDGKSTMKNITLSVDDEVIKKVRKIAIDKDTTLTQMVRDYLHSVAEREVSVKRKALQELERTFEQYSGSLGPMNWTRDDWYER